MRRIRFDSVLYFGFYCNYQNAYVFKQPGLHLWLWPFIIHSWSPSLSPSSHLHSSLHPLLPSSPCWLEPSVAPAWIAARPQSSCHCCAACAGRPPASWGAARPEIHLGPLLCTLPGLPTGWAGEECDFLRAPGAKQVWADWEGLKEASQVLYIIL